MFAVLHLLPAFPAIDHSAKTSGLQKAPLRHLRVGLHYEKFAFSERRLDCRSVRRASENRVELGLSVESQVTRKPSGAPAVPQEKWPPNGGRNLLILK